MSGISIMASEVRTKWPRYSKLQLLHFNRVCNVALHTHFSAERLYRAPAPVSYRRRVLRVKPEPEHAGNGKRRRTSIYLVLPPENLAGGHVVLIHPRRLGLCRNHLVHHSSHNKENDQVYQPETPHKAGLCSCQLPACSCDGHA